MLRANFPGETVEQVIGHLEEQADVAAYIKTLDFPVDIVSCEYHTAYSNPELVNQLHAMASRPRSGPWTPRTLSVPCCPLALTASSPTGLTACGNG
mgnify:FL=1